MAKTAKATFKDSIADFKLIAGDIKRKKFAPIYLLMGEEAYFIDMLGDMLATQILNEEQRGFNQSIAYGKDSDSAAIVNLCRQTPMMGGHNVVIIKEAQQLKKIETLLNYTQKPVSSTVLVICHKEKNLDKRSTLYKSIADKGTVFESVSPKDYELGAWLTEYIASRGLTMDAGAMRMLTDHLGTDISKIAGELKKLRTSLPEGTTTITAEHVERNTGISKDFNNFELTKAISEKDLRKALLIAGYFGNNPKENPLVVTISTIFGHFQRIFLLNYQRWLARKQGTAMPSDFELAKIMNLPGPYFLKEYTGAANAYPNSKVFAIFGLLREYDMKSKGMNAGTADDGELLKELLMKIIYA